MVAAILTWAPQAHAKVTRIVVDLRQPLARNLNWVQ